MSGSNHDSKPADLKPAASTSPGGSGTSVSPWLGALLGEVISQTDRLVEADQISPENQPEALREVARRHLGKELSLDPVITELVEAVISDLAARISREDLRKRLVRHVADTLHDDPAAYQRISSLWANLQRSVQ